MINKYKTILFEYYTLKLNVMNNLLNISAFDNLEFVNMIFDKMPYAFVVLEPIFSEQNQIEDYKFLYVNKNFNSTTGYSKNDVIGSSILTIYPKTEIDWIRKVTKVYETGVQEKVDMFHSETNRYYSSDIFKPANELNIVCISFINNTPKVLLEKELLKSKIESDSNAKRFLGLLDNTEIGVVVHAYDTTILHCNYRSTILLGLSEDQMRGKVAFDPYWQFINEKNEVLSIDEFPVIKIVNSKKEFRNQILGVRRKDHPIVWLLVNGFPLINESGELVEIIINFIDISDIKNAEIDLINTTKQAEKANLQKSYFLANMSHEIRTPMNGILGFANLLKVNDLDFETKNQYIDTIEYCSNQLLNLINDILDISKIESGDLKLVNTNCNLYKMFLNIESTYIEIKKKNLKNHISIVLNVPYSLRNYNLSIDETRLTQVVCNLINNAFKYSNKGTIEFGYNINDEKLLIYVKDEGFGIPENKLSSIFQRFERIENKNENIEGTGLGLSIVSGLVDLMNGKVMVKSELNVGSVFEIELPMVLESTLEQNHTKPEMFDFKKLLNKKILIAEDTKINTQYLNIILSQIPAKKYFVTNGIEALSFFEKNSDIDLVLMDINMPEMNGIDACEQILKLKPNTKIIAQTAYAMNGDKEKYLSKGFVDHISKPINKGELIEMIFRYS